jgi:cytochrome c oxidase subunit 2
VSAPPADSSRTGAPRRRLAAALGGVAAAVVLAGCQVPTFDGYRGSTSQGHDEFKLYAGTVIAGIVIGVFVAALIFWAVIRYRKRSDEIPRQFQYHIPLELTYTVVPVIIVLVIFVFTVLTEDRMTALARTPDLRVKVTAFQWGWRFDYPHRVTVTGETSVDPDPIGLNGGSCAPSVDCLGPGLVLPAGKTTTIQLVSNDTVHGFYVPKFNFSRYAQPGFDQQYFDLKPLHPGVYRAQCTQLCGLYHSLMFFHVVVLPPDQFRSWLNSQTTLTSASTSHSSTSHQEAAA